MTPRGVCIRLPERIPYDLSVVEILDTTRRRDRLRAQLVFSRLSAGSVLDPGPGSLLPGSRRHRTYLTSARRAGTHNATGHQLAGILAAGCRSGGVRDSLLC